MKTLLFLASLVFTSIQAGTNSTAILNALKAGNAEELSKYFDNFIDLKLPEKEEVKNIGKNQASIAVQTFFKDNNIKGFDLSSQRDLGGTMYVAGKLVTNGKPYNVTLMMRGKEGNYQIITVRIN
jgi:hypothetical protein